MVVHSGLQKYISTQPHVVFVVCRDSLTLKWLRRQWVPVVQNLNPKRWETNFPIYILIKNVELKRGLTLCVLLSLTSNSGLGNWHCCLVHIHAATLADIYVNVNAWGSYPQTQNQISGLRIHINHHFTSQLCMFSHGDKMRQSRWIPLWSVVSALTCNCPNQRLAVQVRAEPHALH